MPDASSEPPPTSLQGLAREIVEVRGVAPAAVVGGGIRVGGAWRIETAAWGRLGVAEDEPPASVETPFDLASVTKPVVALTAARLVRRGRLAWSTPLGELLAEA